jgi:myosin-crossreactive antigen
MKQITLSIPEDKYEFFIELLNSIDFVSIDNFSIPDEHKKFVRERKQTATSESIKNWDEVKHQFKVR